MSEIRTPTKGMPFLTIDQAFPFLSLPGEIRNIIYRKHFEATLPGSHDRNLGLFCYPQPALTRVSRQVRAESLSIYYSENRFVLRIYLKDDWRPRDPYEMSYADFYHVMGIFAPAQGQSHSGSGHLCRIRHLWVEIRLHLRTCFAGVGGSEGVHHWHEPCHRVGGDDTDWSDVTGVHELVKPRMSLPSLLPPEDDCTEDRLTCTLAILGNIKLPSDFASSSRRLPCHVWIRNYTY